MANNNTLVLGAIGCLLLTGFAGLSCLGLGGVGWYLSSRPAVTDVAAARTPEAPAGHVDLLSGAAFLDIGAGLFQAPPAPEAAPSEPVPVPEAPPPVVRKRTATEPKAEPEAPPEPPPVEADEPVLSDEDVKALDAEVQQVEAAHEAAATETKRKKKNR